MLARKSMLLLVAVTAVILHNLHNLGESRQATKLRSSSISSVAIAAEEGRAPRSRHWPRNFSNAHNLSNSMKRGNFYTTLGGCKLSRWVYNHPIGGGMEMVHAVQSSLLTTRSERNLTQFAQTMDCIYQPLQKWLHNASQLTPHDTVYVPLNKIDHFVNVTLPQLRVPIVVISSLFATAYSLDPFADMLLSNDHILRWFVSNLGKTLPNHTHHPKVSPWPYGLGENTFREKFRGALAEYAVQFQNTAPQDKKADRLFLTFLGSTSLGRQAIPRGRKYRASGYYARLSAARFVFSPDGDRPDCYRHYEAVGLGVVPITQLDPWEYRHLADAPVIFQNSNWNVSFWNNSLPSDHNISIVNRNLVFEEYWMEYAERDVGKPLMWWDSAQKIPSTLEQIVMSIEKSHA